MHQGKRTAGGPRLPFLAATSLACALWLAGAAVLPAVPSAPPSAAHRVVAIGDLHGDVSAAQRAFRLAGGINERGEWIGRDLVIVQFGDLIGRGDDDRGALDFIFDVRTRAKAGGGTVHVLLGNHEVFGARLELGWVSPKAFAAFEGIPGLELRHPRLAHLPPEARARSAALMPGGLYAKRLADFPAVLRLGDTIYVHGGVTPLWARYGIDRINKEMRDWFTGRTSEPPSSQGVDDGSADDGVMWSRHFAGGAGPEECAMLKESLSILGARRMIVAHTVRPAITSVCDGQAWAIDVGMSRYYGGLTQVLEIIDDQVLSVISTMPAAATR